MDKASPATAGEMDTMRREFGELYLRHHAQLVGWARKLTGTSAVAEDLAAEAFLRAWKSYGRFRGESSFGTWLYRILRNLVIDMKKPATAELIVMPRAGASSEPETVLESRCIAGRIDEALSRLSVNQRQVFLLRELDGLRHAAIAARLGFSESTSKVHYFHALRKLREELRDLV